jgi:ribosomal 30S subunit maturation factor RimM
MEIEAVVDMMKTGNDLLVSKTGDQEVMLPFVSSSVPVVDMANCLHSYRNWAMGVRH